VCILSTTGIRGYGDTGIRGYGHVEGDSEDVVTVRCEVVLHFTFVLTHSFPPHVRYTYVFSSPQVLESSYPVDFPTIDRLVDQALTLAGFSDVAKDVPVLKEAAKSVPAGSSARYVYG
jgi:hypothetical protein